MAKRKSNKRAQAAPSDARWPAYSVERWPIEKAKPFDKNARTHSEKQIEQLRQSLRTFGWTMPLLVREDGTVIAGHGRLEAAKLEAVKDVPVIVARGWSEQQCRAYTLADNRIALNSGWDNENLTAELSDLHGVGTDLGLLGFSEAELARLLPELGNMQPPDATPQLGSGMTFAIVIRCKSETQQTELLARFEGEGLTCEALIS